MLEVENIREARIVAVGNGALMAVLGEGPPVDISNEKVLQAVEGIKARKIPGFGDVATKSMKRGGVLTG